MDKDGIKNLIHKSLVMNLIDAALKKAEEIAPEKFIEVRLYEKNIPKGFHYGEIVGEVQTSAKKVGLEYMGNTGWTFRFFNLNIPA